MKKYIFGLMGMIGMIGLVWTFISSTGEMSVYERYGLEGLSVEEMVETLDRQTLNPELISAGILERELIITTEDGSNTYPVDDELFYLSIAPYINNTHPCHNHNLVTCRNELANETIDVLITTVDGDIIVDETVELFDNGFYGFWLPADKALNLTVHYGDLSVETVVETFDDSGTCLTEELQLS